MKYLSMSVMSIMLLGVLSGCGLSFGSKEPEPPKEPGILETAGALKDLADLGNAANSDNPEDAAKAMEDLAKWGATFEKQEFERTQSTDLPDNFPKAMVYSNAKVTNSSDNSSDDKNLSLHITLKTLDELTPVKDFYKKFLTENGWKITSQNNSADGAGYNASNKATGEEVTISISGNQYSSIREVDIDYYKNPVE